jgi:hypothetical protein
LIEDDTSFVGYGYATRGYFPAAERGLLYFILLNSIKHKLKMAEQVVEKTARVLEAARKNNLYILHVVVQFRPGYPEIEAEYGGAFGADAKKLGVLKRLVFVFCFFIFLFYF